MAVTIRQVEGTPASYPADPDGAITGAALATIWQRLESYICWRWTARSVEWVVEAEGGEEWLPPLKPATISTTEIWQNDMWQAVTLRPSPQGGYILEGCALHRFTGTVGAGTVPPIVAEAFRRLSRYMASEPGKAGAHSESVTLGAISESVRRDPAWLAMAMQNSGAADLLRQFRRVA